MQFCIVQQGGGGEVNGLYVQTEINTNTLPAFPLPTARTLDSVTNFGQGKLTTIRIIYNKTTVEFIVEGNWEVGHLFMNGPPLCAGQ